MNADPYGKVGVPCANGMLKIFSKVKLYSSEGSPFYGTVVMLSVTGQCEVLFKNGRSDRGDAASLYLAKKQDRKPENLGVRCINGMLHIGSTVVVPSPSDDRKKVSGVLTMLTDDGFCRVRLTDGRMTAVMATKVLVRIAKKRPNFRGTKSTFFKRREHPGVKFVSRMEREVKRPGSPFVRGSALLAAYHKQSCPTRSPEKVRFAMSTQRVFIEDDTHNSRRTATSRGRPATAPVLRLMKSVASKQKSRKSVC